MIIKIDAILKDAYIHDNVRGKYLTGTIVEDHKGRFNEGAFVRTSPIKEVDKDTDIVTTLNTTYEIYNYRSEEGNQHWFI